MGLVGWAEAPLGGMRMELENGASVSGVPEVSGSTPVQVESDNAISDNLDTLVNLDKDADIESQLEERIDVPADSSNGLFLSGKQEQCAIQDELLGLISQLELRGDASTSTLDISRIEFHEVVFVIEHASRNETLDYYRIARSLHAVKRRILQSELPPDSISCPNLDELIEYAEELYTGNLCEE